MLLIRSLLFNIWFFGTMIVAMLLMWVLLPFPARLTHNMVRLWSRGVQGGMRLILGLSHEIRGRENLPPGAVLVAAKHQSIWDTTIFHLIFDEPAFVLKKELMSIPLWGWYAKKCGMISVNRAGAAAALKAMVRDVTAKLDQGRPVIIFPEGTRTAPGDEKPYHPGIAALYTAAPVPVVPVALNSGLFWGRRSFLKRPGHIVLEILPPMPGGLDRKVFMAELKTRIEAASARLLAEGRPAA